MRKKSRIKVAQRELSRKKKDSKNRGKRIRLAKFHKTLACQRDDFLHKLSMFYANDYDVIAVEDLNVAGMVRDRSFAKRILDASWSRFFAMLSYKAENAGRILVRVNPRGTSQEYKHSDLDVIIMLRSTFWSVV